MISPPGLFYPVLELMKTPLMTYFSTVTHFSANPPRGANLDTGGFLVSFRRSCARYGYSTHLGYKEVMGVFEKRYLRKNSTGLRSGPKIWGLWHRANGSLHMVF